jgi:redox-sensitive bicupin YhaK (pirin superfamily)
MSQYSEISPTNIHNSRTLQYQLTGMETLDGEGVKLTRIIGSPQLNMLDPFLLLDCFESDDSQDYIGGFPEHPHRGFETVTYMLNGQMRHKDNAGHEGVIKPGGVQWMTAGKGILHSEMPEQEEGLLKGFQLWVNLPATVKMTEPNYLEYPPELTPLEVREGGTEVRVIAGQTNQGTVGPVENNYTNPTYMDITLPANSYFQQDLPQDHNAFVYVIGGNMRILDGQKQIERHNTVLSEKVLGVLTKGEQVSVASGDSGVRFLLVAGQPLNEPVARGGPFVMNTREEIMQAYHDFSSGKF